jgi:hypothetical protein
MTNKLKVVVCVPNERPIIRTIDDNLEAFQEIVGGYIEVVTHYIPGYDIICNEEGRLMDLPRNLFHIRGTFYVTKSNVEGDFISLSEEDLEKVIDFIEEERRTN